MENTAEPDTALSPVLVHGSHAAPQPPSYLLALPLELRDQIYGHVLTSSADPQAPSLAPRPGTISLTQRTPYLAQTYTNTPTQRLYIALLDVSRSVRAEATRVLWTSQIFRFAVPPALVTQYLTDVASACPTATTLTRGLRYIEFDAPLARPAGLLLCRHCGRFSHWQRAQHADDTAAICDFEDREQVSVLDELVALRRTLARFRGLRCIRTVVEWDFLREGVLCRDRRSLRSAKSVMEDGEAAQHGNSDNINDADNDFDDTAAAAATDGDDANDDITHEPVHSTTLYWILLAGHLTPLLLSHTLPQLHLTLRYTSLSPVITVSALASALLVVEEALLSQRRVRRLPPRGLVDLLVDEVAWKRDREALVEQARRGRKEGVLEVVLTRPAAREVKLGRK
ncbi:hypothetical protein B0A49_04594 [Cryomyces minteri]|uniref:F-box domain-containing protein n=1 Tax=Cryomyces minteri TaxID=331657 RepID=A0A4U0XDW6_9PEZI|nr:hypothetical protein B0A49_04594 [Cryomyces minteri]